MRSATADRIVAKRAWRAWRGNRWKLVVAYAAATAIDWALVGPVYASLLVSLAGVVFVSIPDARRWIVSFINAEANRRNTEFALLQAMGEKAPHLRALRPTPVGVEVLVQVNPGSNREEIERAASTLAASFQAAAVRVRPVPKNAALARLVIVCRDRLEGTMGIDQFLAVLPRTSLHHPVPLGFDEDGAVVSVPLLGHHLLVGGEPGSGKSVSLSVLLAAAAFDPTVELWLFDGKIVELSLWRDIANRFVGSDIAEASAALDELIGEMEERYRRILARRARGVSPGDGERLVLVVIDELAFYVAHHDKKAAQVFSDRLSDLVRRARAAGIIVVAATQKPSADLVPSGLRDNFSFRLAHRCATRDASDTILGSGWAANDYSASAIDPAMRGVGYLLAEGGIPRRMRSFSLTDFDIAQIVRYGAQLRRGERNALP